MFTITIQGEGASDDDARDAFGDAVRALRAATPAGGTVTAALSAGGADYTDADVPDVDPADDQP
jgi:hypothetical protein